VLGGGVGADRDDRLARALGRVTHRRGEGLGAAEGGGHAVDGVLAARVDRDVERLRLVGGALRRGLGQVDLQLGVLAVRRREEQEDQHDDQDVDQRDEVEFDLFPLAAAAEIHPLRSPWRISISLIA
jgi:hypothetical protein